MTPPGTGQQPQPSLTLPGASFDALASGGGSARESAFLARGERSRRLLLLGELLDLLEEQPGTLEPLPPAATAWEAISSAARHRPPVVEELLSAPQVGNWIAHALRRLHGTAGGPPLWVDTGHLHALSVVACLRAGVDGSTEVPVRNGEIALPTLGLARLPGCASASPYTTARAEVRNGTLHLTGGAQSLTVEPLRAGRSAGWLPLRTVDRHGRVPLDDLDPYRNLDDPVPPEPLDSTAFEAWRAVFDEAVEILAGHTTPGPGRPVLTDIRCLVPWGAALASAGGERIPVRSASTADAYGSMVLSRPPDGLALAETLVHELQHSKLGAIMHLFPLLDDDRAELYYSPWRPDPRHLTGLLHGAYAFTGVAGFWHDRLGGPHHATAAFQFALRRLHCRHAVSTLLHHARLTPVGRRLVHGLAATLDTWLRHPLDASVVRRARAAARSHLVEWRLRNLRWDPATGTTQITGSLRQGIWHDDRVRLYGLPPALLTDPQTADEHLCAGNPAAALPRYAEALRRNPEDAHARAGRLLATAALHPRLRPALRLPERAAHLMR
ncbi:HEXXH motif domain-containing protein [Streptomyces hiroshimensis]|uniref:HEXXH motif domain-containing protein n=1 Tax=Streptomyces hiroshimensis TaxID=66424 RepID=A0ABQ2Y522_9ACTN|nr:HEXXH motif domain-containing protein [Streptomyces hiroshimensis]GGX64063.1 HEXXH motif domain-containing protein [Streptomyces hiroshimensis]